MFLVWFRSATVAGYVKHPDTSLCTAHISVVENRCEQEQEPGTTTWLCGQAGRRGSHFVAFKLEQSSATPTVPRGQRTGGQTAGPQTPSHPVVVTESGPGLRQKKKKITLSQDSAAKTARW